MEDKFAELLKEDERFVKEAEKYFLNKTSESIDEEDQKEALDTAAQFDDFRRQARDEYGKPFYSGFFATLSELIKRHHEP